MTTPESNPLFTVNSYNIGEYQACRRRFLLSQDWQLARWRPRALFDACLRRGIFRLSQGEEVTKVAEDCAFHYMQFAADPGLETLHDPYRISKDYCSMLHVLLRVLSLGTIMKLRFLDVVPLTSTTGWGVNSYADETGTLHRWLLVASWSESDICRELHSWRVIGDIVTTRCPMDLHIIELGDVRNGRPQCVWARGYRHPGIPHLKMRFKRTTGKDFEGWKPAWLSDQPRMDVNEWVQLILRDDAAQENFHNIHVNVPSDEICDSAVQQIVSEAMAMREMVRDKESISYDMFPMSRNACDDWNPCAFQNVCYTEKPVQIDALGLYKSKRTVQEAK